jgi:hypothetical protein
MPWGRIGSGVATATLIALTQHASVAVTLAEIAAATIVFLCVGVLMAKRRRSKRGQASNRLST